MQMSESDDWEGLKLVGLAGMGHLPAGRTVGRSATACRVARALVLEPQVLLLDEPLSNLDARLRRRVCTEIRDLQQRLGFTAVYVIAIYVTYDQDEALAVSDRIIVMQDGEIAQSGAPRELYEAPASPFIADVMREANMLPCDVVQADAGEVLVRVSNLQHRLRSMAGLGAAKRAVRPGAIRIGAADADGLKERVLHSAYLGEHVEYEVETDVGTLFVIAHDVDHTQAAASDVTLAFKNRGIAVFSG